MYLVSVQLWHSRCMYHPLWSGFLRGSDHSHLKCRTGFMRHKYETQTATPISLPIKMLQVLELKRASMGALFNLIRRLSNFISIVSLHPQNNLKLGCLTIDLQTNPLKKYLLTFLQFQAIRFRNLYLVVLNSQLDIKHSTDFIVKKYLSNNVLFFVF